jgi:hypothetical protein
MTPRAVAVLLAAVAHASVTTAQDADPLLRTEILRIRAIDNHSHAMPASPPGDLPKEPLGSAPYAYPVRLRPRGPEYPRAWEALWSSPRGDPGLRARSALETKWRIRREKGESYPAWVLDQAGIDTVLVNSEELGPGQAPPRFRWVPTADAAGLPARGQAAGPGRAGAVPREVMTPAIEKWKAAGALAVKFTLAYRRLLEPSLNDRELRKTAFVLVHGGWPFERETGVMLDPRPGRHAA